MKGDTAQITKLLEDWSNGDKNAFDELMSLVHQELRRRASASLKNERSGHTLQTTALINEAYINLVDKADIDWDSRSHFYAIASKAMRRILVDYARARKRKKRGGKYENLPLNEAKLVSSGDKSIDLVLLDEALLRLAVFDERQAKIVEFRYFCGMTFDEVAEILDVSNATVRRDWRTAKAWLYKQIAN